MNLDLAFSNDCFLGVAGVTSVAANKDTGETCYTSSPQGVAGVANCPAQPALLHLATPPKIDMWQEIAGVHAGATPVTLATPIKAQQGILAGPEAAESGSPGELPEPAHDPFEYAEDFGRWALAHCVFRDRCWGGIAKLYREWCAWCFLEQVVPANLPTFRALLEDEGFILPNRTRHGPWAVAPRGLGSGPSYLPSPTPAAPPEKRTAC